MGSKYENLTQDELINELIKIHDIEDSEKVRKALEWAFTEGWNRGEDFGRTYYK